MKTTRTRQDRRRSSLGIQGRNVATVLIVLIVAACVGYARLPTETDEIDLGADPGADTFTGRVTRVVDGDTFYISSREQSIRLWGLDAPETNTPTGPLATAALERLISGEPLTCRQRDIDRYGRIVGQCFLSDGRDITAAMIASGVATEYCRYSGNYYRTC